MHNIFISDKIGDNASNVFESKYLMGCLHGGRKILVPGRYYMQKCRSVCLTGREGIKGQR